LAASYGLGLARLNTVASDRPAIRHWVSPAGRVRRLAREYLRQIVDLAGNVAILGKRGWIGGLARQMSVGKRSKRKDERTVTAKSTEPVTASYQREPHFLGLLMNLS
jgi:hypothetical protein